MHLLFKNTQKMLNPAVTNNSLKYFGNNFALVTQN